MTTNQKLAWYYSILSIVFKSQAERDVNPNNIYNLYSEKPASIPQSDKDQPEKVNDKTSEKFYNDICCESPSSGFGSVSSKYSAPDLRQDANTSVEQESIYNTAATVRLNKKLQNNSEADKIFTQNRKMPIKLLILLVKQEECTFTIETKINT